VTLINRAVSQVDEVTQHNAAAAEELASTADTLAGQAEALRQMMAFFKVSSEQRAESASPSRLASRTPGTLPGGEPA